MSVKVKKYGILKTERLKSKKTIEKLFTGGYSFVEYPIRVVFKPNDLNTDRIALSVSKKRFKLAVDRNQVKRYMRESYRVNKRSNSEKSFDILFIFLAKEIVSTKKITPNIQSILKKIESYQ